MTMPEAPRKRRRSGPIGHWRPRIVARAPHTLAPVLASAAGQLSSLNQGVLANHRKMAADGGACIICLETSPPPIQSGCACRGDSGLAHIACIVRAATSQQAQRGSGVWQQCQTCKQYYTGAMQTGLAEAWRSRVAGESAENTERLEAEYNLAMSLLCQGKNAEAEPMFRKLHEVMMRVHGAENPSTLLSAGNLASSLFDTLIPRQIRRR
jgi:hypothetical protein